MGADGRITVAFISGAAYTGGAEKYIELLAGGLERERFETVLITSGSQGLESLRSAVRNAGVSNETTDGRPLASPRGARQLLQILRRLRPDIVHVNMPGPFDCAFGLPVSVARLSGARRIVTTEHLPMVESFAKAKILRYLHMRHVSRFITVSEDNRIHLVHRHRVPEEKIRVVHNGIPDPVPAGLASRSGDGRVNLLMAGALEERKGHRVILSVMELLPDGISLSIAGDGPLRAVLEAESGSEKFGGRVNLLGSVEDMPGLISRSDILVVPSLLEATPYVILEAMAAGKPVVASGIYGIPEQVEDGVTGILINPGDVVSFAEAILRLSTDSELSSKMGEAGRKRYRERFSLERSVAGTVKVYEELL
jgi:glycosyltransferase involved in cell wall biosynthesis